MHSVPWQWRIICTEHWKSRYVRRDGKVLGSLEKMVKDNLTTCVEDGVNGRSDCHAWGSLILFELPAVVLGVHPAAPGYEKIAVEPNPGYLEWAKGEVITKREW